MPDRRWYAAGLRFSCTQCGNCCTGPPGAVWFTEEEGARLAAHLGLSERAFRRRFARRLSGAWSLVERRTAHGYDCIFLDRETQPGRAVCAVYESRPTQCRTWPFWPENVASPEAWASAKGATPCPGMGRGNVVTVEEIETRLRRRREVE